MSLYGARVILGRHRNDLHWEKGMARFVGLDTRIVELERRDSDFQEKRVKVTADGAFYWWKLAALQFPDIERGCEVGDEVLVLPYTDQEATAAGITTMDMRVQYASPHWNIDYLVGQEVTVTSGTKTCKHFSVRMPDDGPEQAIFWPTSALTVRRVVAPKVEQWNDPFTEVWDEI